MEIQPILSKKLDHWKRQLIDLSKRNNLISYRFTKSKSLKVDAPGFDQVLVDLNHGGNIRFLTEKSESEQQRVWLCSEDEETIGKKLYNLYLKARENFQELGISTCFISLGMFQYKESQDSEIIRQAPIFLYSVEIGRARSAVQNFHRFQILPEDGDLQLNPALVELLAHDHGIELNEFDPENLNEYISYLEKVARSVKGSQITKEVYVDIFSYQKYIMYDDLIRNEEAAKNSALVRAYVGDPDALQDEVSELLREDFDDTTSADVLPADSSQKRAIELAKAGVTFVLQGPPGTGKSQTIVNIISALIQQKKKVLFVSQKMAALNVVQKRLEEVDLSRYCLNLHTYKGNKKEVVKQLMHEYQTKPRMPEAARTFSFGSYLSTQKELNEYYAFLGKKREPWNLSVYDLRGKIAGLHHIDDSRINTVFSELLPLPPETVLTQVDTIRRIQGILETVGNPMDSWLIHYKKSMNTMVPRRNFGGLLASFRKTLQSISGYAEKISASIDVAVADISAFEGIEKIEGSLEGVEEIPEFLFSAKFRQHSTSLDSLHKNLTNASGLKRDMLLKVRDSFLEEDLDTHEKVLQQTGIFGRVFNREYRNSKRALGAYAKGRIGHSEWLNLFSQKRQSFKLCEKQDEIIKDNGFGRTIGDPKDISIVGKLSKLCQKIEPAFEQAQDISKQRFPDIVRYCASSKDKVGEELAAAREQISELNQSFEDFAVQLRGELNDIIKETDRTIELLSHLNEIVIFREQRQTLEKEAQEFVTDYLESGTTDPIVDVFNKVYYLQVLETILQEENKLSPKDLVERFRNEDGDIRDKWHLKIMQSVQEDRPSVSFQSTGANEVQTLKRESQKQRSLKPIRILLHEIPTLVFKLKPCFMMSPLTVSQYIDPKQLVFDVVIFDEASQIMPEDAVACLMRAKQAIVMGDTQQLPPTTFFSSHGDEDVEEDVEDLDSFLSESSVKFREKSLEWHYRSNCEELIAFSNRFFYGNRLITFPNHKESSDQGISVVYVKNGVYDRGKSRKNPAEARQVVDTYQALRQNNRDKSFGIIAFSMAQENAIREAFLQKGVQLEENIDPHAEELFIKNLETVQGDERDIIIMSVGYGKDSRGQLSYNFGPINKSNGFKRLNVAITRARDQTVVVSSILPQDLDDARINAEGLRHLKNYLDFGMNKNFDKLITSTEHLGFDSSFEEAVHGALVEEGHDVVSQVGCSGYRIDLAIKHPKRKGEYVLGIECDGAQYHSSHYARDRDKIRQSVLERLGWNILRIWSEDWLNNREHEIERVKNVVNALVGSKASALVKEQSCFTPVEEEPETEEVSLDEQYTPYHIAELPASNLTLGYDSQGNLTIGGAEVQRLMKMVIEVESPIEKELLFQRVRESLGLGRLGKRSQIAFGHLLNQLKRTEGIIIDDQTVSKEEIPDFVQVRVSTEEQRPFANIPKEELGGAIIDILRNTFSIEKSALISDIARGIFGNNRTGTRITSKVSEAIEYMIDKNHIIEENGTIKLKDL